MVQFDANGSATPLLEKNSAVAHALYLLEPEQPRRRELSPPPARKRSLWRWPRRCLAAAIFLLLLWWFVVPFLFPVTNQAVINARTVQVRVPITGTSAELWGDIGEEIAAKQPLLVVTNQRVDTVHLAELNGRVSALEAQRVRLIRERDKIKSIEPVFRGRVERYNRVAMDSLKSLVEEANLRCELKRLEIGAAQKQADRLETLARTIRVSPAEKEESRASILRAHKQLEKERLAWTRLKGELDAGGKGVFLQHEAPYSHKQVDDLVQNLAGVEAGLIENSALLAAARVQVSAEEKRVDRLKRACVLSPVAGTVWKRAGNAGQVVKQNEVIYEIADRKTIFVEALFHQRYLSSSIAPGARATVNLTSGQHLVGRVRAMRTIGEATAESAYAINLPTRDVKDVRVLIALDDENPPADLIGRHVRVLITAAEPGPVEQAVAWMFSQVGG